MACQPDVNYAEMRAMISNLEVALGEHSPAALALVEGHVTAQGGTLVELPLNRRTRDLTLHLHSTLKGTEHWAAFLPDPAGGCHGCCCLRSARRGRMGRRAVWCGRASRHPRCARTAP